MTEAATQVTGTRHARRRNVIERLSALAAGLLIIALAVSFSELRDQPIKAEAGPFFVQSLDAGDIARLEIVSRQERFSIVAHEDGFLFEDSNQTILLEEMARFADALNSWQRLERRTARPEMLERINLQNPEEGGAAVRIRIATRDGQSRDLLLGAVAKERGFYVRSANDSQAWLVDGIRPPYLQALDWAKRFAFDWTPDDIVRLRISPPDAMPYSLVRSASGWQISEGDADPERALQIAARLSELSFIDATASASLLSAPLGLLEAQRRDGLSVTLALLQENNRDWVIIAAGAANEDALQAAEAISAATRGQAFALRPEDRFALFDR